MKTTKQSIASPSDKSCEALERSEKQAYEHDPEEFNEAGTNRKIVEVGPVLGKDPIKGLDPAK